jgi:hypothetical protein
MNGTIGLLVMAAALEIGGGAAVRRGLIHSASPLVLFGVATLSTPKLIVNSVIGFHSSCKNTP